MVDTSTFAAIILHLCAFTSNGENYAAVPLIDMLALQESARKGANLPGVDPKLMVVIVKPSTDGCQPYDGENIPGLEKKGEP